ncbi:YtzH-like family protein [Bacillus sp. FJAT-47783]|uniref:YtzH-like family protein n=1 Tax=Bacillus sp. FJAT-47783 TaxID=2922712 RepID=UPI001FADEAFE|nr:YtzH-like family protein [Bacillus sp. FJAT-47783]
MQLNHKHQLMLLKDILSEQHSECCGTDSEYEQMERLIQSLLQNNEVNETLKQSLQNMYQYSQGRNKGPNFSEHITAYKDDIPSWITDLNTFS